ESLENENSLLHELCDFTVYSKNDALGVIDTQTGYYKFFPCNAHAWGKKRYEGDYQDALERVLSKRENDGDTYQNLQLLSLDEIVPRIQEEKKVRIKINLKERRGKRWKLIEYSFFKKDQSRIVYIVQDIHEEEMDRAKLKAAIKEAKEANAAKSEFLANLSHEIRTPMNTIVGLSEVILRQDVPETIKDDLVCIQNAGKGLLEIINDVLDLSKIKSGKFKLENHPYQLEMILTNVLNMISIQLVDKDVSLLMEISPEIPVTMVGDALRIKQILLNILGNAVKFTEHGSIRLQIGIKKRKKSRVQLEIMISDTGIGIKAFEMRRLFEKFYQADSKKDNGKTGTGLGLTISKSLAQLMDGDISIDSIYGEGTTFTVTLWQQCDSHWPMLDVNAYEAERCLVLLEEASTAEMVCRNLEQMSISAVPLDLRALSASHSLSLPFTYVITDNAAYTANLNFFSVFQPEQMILLQDYTHRSEVLIPGMIKMSTHLFPLQMMHFLKGEEIVVSYRQKTLEVNRMADLSGFNVLIVDDNATNRMVAKELMRPYHLSVALASSGAEAVERVKAEHFDLVFLDYRMPKMDGVETLRAIRQIEGCSVTPVVALTANGGPGVKAGFLRKGFQDYLPKPIDVYDLDRIMNVYLGTEKHHFKGKSSLGNSNLKNEAFQPEVFVQKSGIEEDVYHTLLHTFSQELKDGLIALKGDLDRQDLHEFTIGIHGLKSAAKAVGANELSLIAKALEDLGNQDDFETIKRRFPVFKEKAEETIEIIAYYAQENVQNKRTKKHLDHRLLAEIRQCSEELEYTKIKGILDELDQYQYAERQQCLLNDLIACYESFEFEALDALIKQWKEDDI
ncbi:MAG: ATP-binding protein, partial [Eubacterium sp.]